MEHNGKHSSNLVTISNQPGSLENIIKGLSQKERAICESLHKFNQLRSYPLDAVSILEWKDSIIKLAGDKLDIHKLDFAIEKMISGDIEYDKQVGIQNIFNALRSVKKTDIGYGVNDFTW